MECHASTQERTIPIHLVPANVLFTTCAPSSIPGAGRYRFVATRDSLGSYAFVYAPVGRPFKVRMNVIAAPKVRAWWFNPRNAKETRIGEFTNTKERAFIPSDKGELLDWVLVLEDAAQNFPPPGVSMLK
jgi:hypothetical protein